MCRICGECETEHDHCEMCVDSIADPKFSGSDFNFCEDCARSIAEETV